nr:reverse transcriptase domain-containing protein [Tanacetum cinerariifolium]
DDEEDGCGEEAAAGRWRWCRSMVGWRWDGVGGQMGWPEKLAGTWWRRRKVIGEGEWVIRKQLNLGVGTKRMIFHIDSAMKHSYSNDDTCFSIDVIDEILEEDFDALLDEVSEILHSIKGTILEEKIFAEFDELMAMIADENSKSESDTEEPLFEKNHLYHQLQVQNIS